jgi:hypothetical protein
MIDKGTVSQDPVKHSKQRKLTNILYFIVAKNDNESDGVKRVKGKKTYKHSL